jgi:hypothetical protein
MRLRRLIRDEFDGIFYEVGLGEGVLNQLEIFPFGVPVATGDGVDGDFFIQRFTVHED